MQHTVIVLFRINSFVWTKSCVNIVEAVLSIAIPLIKCHYLHTFILASYLSLFLVGAIATSLSSFGVGSGEIHLDDLMCTGEEESLLDCPNTMIHNCLHIEDAGVICQGCVAGHIRLSNGFRTSEGRVEVCRNNVWGTICDIAWGQEDATVVCRQLGWSITGAVAQTGNFYGPTADTMVPIYAYNFGCTSTEQGLVDCPFLEATGNCLHSQDAGVQCSEFGESP